MKKAEFIKEDKFKNALRLVIFYDESNQPTNANIFLELVTEKKKRNLGQYNFINKTLYVERKSSKHYHYTTKSYGFNHELINDDFLDIQWIVADIDGTKYRFPKKTIDDYGRFLQFSNQGFELQKFVPFALIKNYKS